MGTKPKNPERNRQKPICRTCWILGTVSLGPLLIFSIHSALRTKIFQTRRLGRFGRGRENSRGIHGIEDGVVLIQQVVLFIRMVMKENHNLKKSGFEVKFKTLIKTD